MSKNNFQIMNARVTFRNMPLYKLANFSFKDIPAACRSFKENASALECIIVQTSSRIEVFTVGNVHTGETPDARRAEGKKLDVSKILKTWSSLVELDQFDLDHWDQTLEIYKDIDVYEHLLRLASGLESLVVGKEEILVELKKSISSAKEAKTSGKILDKLFDTCIRIATNIRDSSGIDKGIESVGDKAVKLAEESMGDVGSKHVLLIGTGEIAGLVAKSLNKKSYAFDVTSMTIERATGFSKILGGNPIEFEGVLPEKKKGTLMMDLSEPRTVDEKVATIPGIKLVNPEQIAEMIEDSTKARKSAISAAEELIKEELPIIQATMKQLSSEPLVKA